MNEQLPFVGVRVDGDAVIVKMRSNDEARTLCGAMFEPPIIAAMQAVAKSHKANASQDVPA